MKKNYTEPTIYIENVVVENGIAASLQTVDGVNNIYLNEEEVDW